MQKSEFVNKLKAVDPSLRVLVPFNTSNIRAFKGIFSVEPGRYSVDFTQAGFLQDPDGLERGSTLLTRDINPGESVAEYSDSLLTAGNLLELLESTGISEGEWVLVNKNKALPYLDFIVRVEPTKLVKDPLFDTLWVTPGYGGVQGEEEDVLLLG